MVSVWIHHLFALRVSCQYVGHNTRGQTRRTHTESCLLPFLFQYILLNWHEVFLSVNIFSEKDIENNEWDKIGKIGRNEQENTHY